MMKRRIASMFASLLGLSAVGACAVDGALTEQKPTPASARYGHSAVTALEGLVFDDGDGVTDEQAYSVELPSGSTDLSIAITVPGEVSSKADTASCVQTGSVACTPNSTGAGVQHGSPQPLDPSPTGKVQKSNLQGR